MVYAGFWFIQYSVYTDFTVLAKMKNPVIFKKKMYDIYTVFL